MQQRRRPKILVVGDAMVDQYHFGTTTRISPEAPIPVVKITSHETFHGGAANVFTNLVALGAEVRLRAGEPTPIKNRLMVGTTQIARWDENDEVRPISMEALETPGWTPDAIVVSDYGKGSINYDVRNWLYLQGKRLFVDSKASPTHWSWHGVTLFPNQIEYAQYEFEYKDRPDVIYKRGKDGIAHLQRDAIIAEFPAYARNVVSVCGAGDTVIAAYTYFTALGDPAALFNASVAAAIVVEKPWTATASVAEIEERIKCLDTKKV